MQITADRRPPTSDELGFVPARERAPRILARSLYRELLTKGFTPDQVLAMASELVELVTEEDRH